MYSRQIIFLLAVVILAVVPSVLSRKCYVCNSQQNPACADGYQTGQMQYVDCSNQQYGGGYNPQFPQGQPGIQPPGVGQPGGFPGQQLGYGGDRCIKVTTVGQVGINGQPVVTRSCGSSMNLPMGGSTDSCIWQGTVQTCTCDSNYCNGSSQLSKSAKSIALVTGFVTLLASMIYRQSL